MKEVEIMLRDIKGNKVKTYDELIGLRYLEYEFLGFDKNSHYKLIIDRTMTFTVRLIMFKNKEFFTNIYNKELSRDDYDLVYNFLLINDLKIKNRDLELRLDTMYELYNEKEDLEYVTKLRNIISDLQLDNRYLELENVKLKNTLQENFTHIRPFEEVEDLDLIRELKEIKRIANNNTIQGNKIISICNKYLP